tara:strand:+ start:69592 stop:70026 length:435 start_codon:yes stop_codon:yes gene_type:complete
MIFFVNKLTLFFFFGILISSCVDLKAKKGHLKFSIKEGITAQETQRTIPIGSNFESLYENLIKKSCLDCHHSDFGVVSFESKEEFIDNAENIKFYIEFGCDFGTCMPPVDEQGKPVRPIPSTELITSLGEWIDNGYEDLEVEVK